MKRLLLTGYPGWLSGRLLESLLEDPLPQLEAVRCLMLPSIQPPAIENKGPVTIEYAEADLRDASALDKACEGCDGVLHAAGILHPKRTQDWYTINTEGTADLLKGAEKQGASRFVFISSNAAAGSSPSQDILLTEAMTPKPRSHYGKSKLLAEEIVHASKLQTLSLRPCMFYGPPVPIRHVDIYKRLLHGRMPMVGNGNYARSVTHVENLVQACRLTLTNESVSGEAFYIADEEPATTREIVEAMAKALGTTPNYLHLPALIAEVAYATDISLAAMGFYWQDMHLLGEADWHVGVSIDKAKELLQYQPTKNLHQGMAEAIEWCRQKQLL